MRRTKRRSQMVMSSAEIAAIYEGGWGDRPADAPPAPAAPASPPTPQPEPAATPAPAPTAAPPSANALMAQLLAEYEAEGDLDPLTMNFTFAGFWEDLALLTGEALPPFVLAALRTIGGERPEPEHVPLDFAYAAMKRDRSAAAGLPA